jgi:hypothetical protein
MYCKENTMKQLLPNLIYSLGIQRQELRLSTNILATMVGVPAGIRKVDHSICFDSEWNIGFGSETSCFVESTVPVAAYYIQRRPLLVGHQQTDWLEATTRLNQAAT